MQEHIEESCQEQCFHPEVVESVRRDMLGSVPADDRTIDRRDGEKKSFLNGLEDYAP